MRIPRLSTLCPPPGKNLRAAGFSYLGSGTAFLAVAASGQPAFLGVGCAFIGIGIAFIARGRTDGR
jgi:hypothetical protein